MNTGLSWKLNEYGDVDVMVRLDVKDGREL